MPGRLSYEPSVEDVFRHALGSGASFGGDPEALRRRVSWPVTLRARGIGEIAGGEILLVPAARAEWVAGQGQDLAEAGVAALVIEASRGKSVEPGSSIPTAYVASGSDLRILQDELERYIMRRRRELFALEQDLHRLLVEAALAGRGLDRLLALASDRSGRVVLIERDGQTIGSGSAQSGPPLEQVRKSPQETLIGCRWLPGPPPSLAMEVPGGRRRNVVVLIAEGPSKDEDEALVTTLVSACAIALVREPDIGVRDLDQLLEAARQDSSSGSWSALAISASGALPARLERVVVSECEARGMVPSVGRSGDSLVVLLGSQDLAAASGLARALLTTLGPAGSRLGVSRGHRGTEGARKAAGEAITALSHADAGQVVEYEAVEVEALLTGIREWEPFVSARLGPILSGNSSRGDLVATLGAYLAAAKNTSEAARTLGIHRNTLIYRLARIQDLLAVDLDNSEDTFALELAIRLLRLHRAQPMGQ